MSLIFMKTVVTAEFDSSLKKKKSVIVSTSK